MDMTLRPATSNNRIRPRAWPQLARHADAWRWPSWAARVAERYGAHGEAWNRLSATLRALGPAQVTQNQQITWHNNLYQRPQSQLALTLRLALLATTAGNRAATGHAAGLPNISTVVVQAGLPSVEPAGRSPTTAGPHWTTPMLMRRPTTASTAVPWFAQHTPLRTLVAQPSATAPNASAAPAAMILPPVPRIVPHSAPAAATAPPPVAAPPELSAALNYWGDSSPAAPPNLNVEQLTDQVIRTLDQRVVAARERLGKS